MDLTIKHIFRKEEVRRQLDILLSREKIRALTDEETDELLSIQTEFYRLMRLDVIRVRFGWQTKQIFDLGLRHDLAQALSVHDRIATLQSFRRSFDVYIDASLDTLNREAFSALIRNPVIGNKLSDLRADCIEPDAEPEKPDALEEFFDDIEKDTDEKVSNDTQKQKKRKLKAGEVIVHRYARSDGRDDKERDAFAKKLAEPKIFKGPWTVDDVDELFSALYDESPWLSEPIKHIWSEARNNAAYGEPFAFSPVLMFGGPGLGKSHMATSLARLSGCPIVHLNGGNMTSAFDIAGVEKAWRSASPGVCVRAIHDHGIANPVVIVDEIDKTPRGSSGGDPQLALLPLLQADTAEGYRCPYVQGVVDLSFVNWLACANDISSIPRPLIDRFAVFEIHAPTGEVLMHFFERRFEGLDVPRIKLIEMKKAIETGRMSLRGALKLEARLRAYDSRPLLN